jgi:Trk-type K+ transport system membrane component
MQELGGVEYRALKLLSWLLPAYSFSCLILTMLFLLPYSARKSISATLRNSQPGDLNPQWWAFFLSASSYSNTGLDLMDQSMIRKQNLRLCPYRTS